MDFNLVYDTSYLSVSENITRNHTRGILSNKILSGPTGMVVHRCKRAILEQARRY